MLLSGGSSGALVQPGNMKPKQSRNMRSQQL